MLFIPHDFHLGTSLGHSTRPISKSLFPCTLFLSYFAPYCRLHLNSTATMSSKHDNGLPLTEKRTYNNASLTSPATKDVDYTRDPANGSAMGDSGNSPCKSTRGLQKKAFVSENRTVTKSSSLTPKFDGINRLSKFLSSISIGRPLRFVLLVESGANSWLSS